MSAIISPRVHAAARARAHPRARASRRGVRSHVVERARRFEETEISLALAFASVSRRSSVTTRAASDDADADEERAKEVAKNLEDLLPGDERVRDEITSQLKYQTKLFKAQQFLDEKKEEIQERGDAGKEALEAEAKIARDRAGLEIGLRASEIDDKLAEMLDETAAARARNEKVQAELAELEEQLTGKSSGRFRKAPNAPKTVSAMKQAAIDKEAEDVDARMRSTLEETQRKSAFTLILLLLLVTDISMAAEWKLDAFFAITTCVALVGYQAKNENTNAENR